MYSTEEELAKADRGDKCEELEPVAKGITSKVDAFAEANRVATYDTLSIVALHCIDMTRYVVIILACYVYCIIPSLCYDFFFSISTWANVTKLQKLRATVAMRKVLGVLGSTNFIYAALFRRHKVSTHLVLSQIQQSQIQLI
jgi:hypothetical protein